MSIQENVVGSGTLTSSTSKREGSPTLSDMIGRFESTGGELVSLNNRFRICLQKLGLLPPPSPDVEPETAMPGDLSEALIQVSQHLSNSVEELRVRLNLLEGYLG